VAVGSANQQKQTNKNLKKQQKNLKNNNNKLSLLQPTLRVATNIQLDTASSTGRSHWANACNCEHTQWM